MRIDPLETVQVLRSTTPELKTQGFPAEVL